MFPGLVLDWPELLCSRNGSNYTEISTHRSGEIKGGGGGGADVCVDLQKEAVLTVIKLSTPE